MLTSLAKKVFGSRNDRLLKKYRKDVAKINALEPQMQALSDEALQAKTAEFKQRLEKGETLDQLLIEAFAVCREAGQRVLGMRHFDVQLIGGMVLHQGKIAEMRTGEGKTLVATLAVYLNALAGKGVHVVTVNDYLAVRDANLMARLYNFLGLTVGTVVSDMETWDKQAAYRSDICYGTNNEFGFDYLRDNMVGSQEERVQTPLYFAVVDEVDSILIDEARTPLIISGQADDNIQVYQVMNQVPAYLQRQESEDGDGDYWVDEKNHTVSLSEQGHEHAEQILVQLGLLPEGDSLYASNNIMLMHHLTAALRAHTLFHKDQNYVVQDGEIVIVDEFTGRLSTGRRWSDGLHQAIEAKEGVEVKKENQTLASVTFQNYFRLYEKLSGMTGTADTEAFEFQSIYGLETVIIPPNRKPKRKDLNDQIFRTAEEKYEAVINDIQSCYTRGQPVLVGTASIETSELVAELLTKQGLKHNVLNAKEHAREAEIIAQAGKPGMITVATNMAGRGTDIVLGGNIDADVKAIEINEQLSDVQKAQKIADLKAQWQIVHDEVLAAGGLHIIGTERHESRRIDNQLRGRSGRQGDEGSSRFYLSFEDQLLRLFAMDKAKFLLDKLAPERGMPIEASLLTRQIEGAQRKVEGRNFDIRKQLLEYDDVANDQRQVIYARRNDLLEHEDVSDVAKAMRMEVLEDLVDHYIPPQSMEEEWDVEGLVKVLATEFSTEVDIAAWIKADNNLENEGIKELLLAEVEAAYTQKMERVGKEQIQGFERSVSLQVLDHRWREHLAAMDYLRQGIHLRGYAQKNPKQEYKREAFAMFEGLLKSIQDDVVRLLVGVRVEENQQIHQVQDDIAPTPQQDTEIDYSPAALTARGIHILRNDPCPCGSGVKYKQCHGSLV